LNPAQVEISPAIPIFSFQEPFYVLFSGSFSCGLRFEHIVLNLAISETFLSKSLLNIGKC